MSVNRCTDVCSGSSEYTVTNIVMVRYRCNLSCGNICVSSLWKLNLVLFRTSLLKIYFEIVGKDLTKRLLEYFCQRLYSVGGVIFCSRTTSRHCSNLFLCQITPFFPGTVHIERLVVFPLKIKLPWASVCFQFWLCVHTVICCHVNNIQVYLRICKCFFPHPECVSNHCFFPMKMTFWCRCIFV